MDGQVRYQINCTHLCFYFRDHIHRIPYPDLPHHVQPTVATAMGQCWRMAAEAQASISHQCYPQEGVLRLCCNVSLMYGGFGARSLVNASDLPLGELLSPGSDGSFFLNWFADTLGRLLRSFGWHGCLVQLIRDWCPCLVMGFGILWDDYVLWFLGLWVLGFSGV